MVKSLLPLTALLMGSAFLLFAGGINALILPLRGEAEGFTAASLGLLGLALSSILDHFVCGMVPSIGAGNLEEGTQKGNPSLEYKKSHRRNIQYKHRKMMGSQ